MWSCKILVVEISKLWVWITIQITHLIGIFLIFSKRVWHSWTLLIYNYMFYTFWSIKDTIILGTWVGFQ